MHLCCYWFAEILNAVILFDPFRVGCYCGLNLFSRNLGYLGIRLKMKSPIRTHSYS
jgi:hypothetical protein